MSQHSRRQNADQQTTPQLTLTSNHTAITTSHKKDVPTPRPPSPVNPIRLHPRTETDRPGPGRTFGQECIAHCRSSRSSDAGRHGPDAALHSRAMPCLIFRSEYRAGSRMGLALCSTKPCGMFSRQNRRNGRRNWRSTTPHDAGLVAPRLSQTGFIFVS
jgi:hypothetical protein